MRLSRNVCMACIVSLNATDGLEWNQFDDERWEHEDVVICPFRYVGFGMPTNRVKINEIPKWCPYSAEHLVSQ